MLPDRPGKSKAYVFEHLTMLLMRWQGCPMACHWLGVISRIGLKFMDVSYPMEWSSSKLKSSSQFLLEFPEALVNILTVAQADT
jgi:hypothetical protein